MGGKPVALMFKKETVTMFKMLSLHQGVERSYYDSELPCGIIYRLCLKTSQA